MTRLRVASINTNGIRAAYRKGMAGWLDARDVDVLAIQEVRADTADVLPLLGSGWHVLHEAAVAKGRAGVVVASRVDGAAGAPIAHRTGPGIAEFAAEGTSPSGRWLEADFSVDGKTVTVVSTYIHSGEVDTPRQLEKYAFLEAMTSRLQTLAAEREYAVAVGDMNVGHLPFDIKNWRGNVKNSGFLPQERAYFFRFFGPSGEPIEGPDGSIGPGLGWVDVGRRFAGEVDGPYTWWSQRGNAFDNDTGWRIDYQIATPALAAAVADYKVDRYPSYDARWSRPRAGRRRLRALSPTTPLSRARPRRPRRSSRSPACSRASRRRASRGGRALRSSARAHSRRPDRGS